MVCDYTCDRCGKRLYVRAKIWYVISGDMFNPNPKIWARASVVCDICDPCLVSGGDFLPQFIPLGEMWRDEARWMRTAQELRAGKRENVTAPGGILISNDREREKGR